MAGGIQLTRFKFKQQKFKYDELQELVRSQLAQSLLCWKREEPIEQLQLHQIASLEGRCSITEN